MDINIECLEGQEKLLNILESYFRNAAKYHPEPGDAGKTTYFSSVGSSFVSDSANTLIKLRPTSPLFSQHENLLQSLAASLHDLHDDLAAQPPPDYLFFASLSYVDYFLRYDLDGRIIKTDIGRNLILAILQYHAACGAQLRRDIEEGFHNTLGFGFEEDWPCFVQRAEGLGVVLPPPVAQLVIDSPPLEGAEIQEEPCQPFGDAIVNVRVDTLS